MKPNKVQRSKHYTTKRRRSHTTLKVTTVLLTLLVIAAGVVFVVSLTSAKPQPTSAEPNSLQPVESNENKPNKVESSEISEEVSKRDPKLPDYSNSFKYTEKLIDDSSINDEIDSKYVILYDSTTDTVLYKKSAEEKCYPASTTKLLTAIVANKILDNDEIITVGNEITLIGEDSSIAGLEVGQKLTAKQLLYALLLPSGNDAAYTLAVASARKFANDDNLSAEKAISTFSELMNDAAKELGAENSHFTNPDGFHDQDHYTTAFDLLKIANYAKSIPLINEICGTYQTTQIIKSGEEFYWVNSNKLLNQGEYCYSEYADGMKTGFTDEAGTSVISSFTKDGSNQIVVTMNSSELYKKYYDALLLAQYGFKQSKIDFDYTDLPEDYYNYAE